MAVAADHDVHPWPPPPDGAHDVPQGEGGLGDMPTVKPVDREAILRAAATSRRLMTVEEHNIIGGLDAAVAEVLADEGAAVRLRRHGIYDEYSLIAPPTHLYEHYRLDAAVALETLDATA